MASKDKAFYSKNTLNLNGNLLEVSIPKIMGILNVTDDSFYDGKRFLDEHEISKQVEKLINDGADIIDIGGYSSRPGAIDIDERTELKRVLKGISSTRDVSKQIPISVDTFRSNVARESIESGAAMINDISGGNIDSQMFKMIAEYQVSYVLMHMIGNPQSMFTNVVYDDLIGDMLDYLSKKLQELTHFGIKDVIIDVGFGFSKTALENYELLSALELIGVLNTPLMVGLSRKSMIYKVLKTDPEHALNGTSVLHTISLLSGVDILRVHDAREAKEVIDLVKLLNN